MRQSRLDCLPSEYTTMSAEDILRPDYRLSPGKFLDLHKQGRPVAGPAHDHSYSLPAELS